MIRKGQACWSAVQLWSRPTTGSMFLEDAATSRVFQRPDLRTSIVVVNF
jgi:hypothetical protein